MATTSPGRKLGRPRDADSVETRARLLVAARQCFGVRGFDRTTNSEIARAAGITSAAIYHYFPSKVDLYVAVYAEVQNYVYAEFETAIAPCSTLIERFNAALDVSVRINREDPTIAGFVVEVPFEVQRHPELGSVLKPLQERTAKFVNGLCADAYRNGEIREGVPQEALEDLLSVILAGLLRFSTQIGDSRRHAAAVSLLQTALRSTDALVAEPVSSR
jgi:AcrR family transcriptional regulator